MEWFTVLKAASRTGPAKFLLDFDEELGQEGAGRRNYSYFAENPVDFLAKLHLVAIITRPIDEKEPPDFDKAKGSLAKPWSFDDFIREVGLLRNNTSRGTRSSNNMMPNELNYSWIDGWEPAKQEGAYWDSDLIHENSLRLFLQNDFIDYIPKRNLYKQGQHASLIRQLNSQDYQDTGFSSSIVEKISYKKDVAIFEAFGHPEPSEIMNMFNKASTESNRYEEGKYKMTKEQLLFLRQYQQEWWRNYETLDEDDKLRAITYPFKFRTSTDETASFVQEMFLEGYEIKIGEWNKVEEAAKKVYLNHREEYGIGHQSMSEDDDLPYDDDDAWRLSEEETSLLVFAWLWREFYGYWKVSRPDLDDVEESEKKLERHSSFRSNYYIKGSKKTGKKYDNQRKVFIDMSQSYAELYQKFLKRTKEVYHDEVLTHLEGTQKTWHKRLASKERAGEWARDFIAKNEYITIIKDWVVMHFDWLVDKGAQYPQTLYPNDLTTSTHHLRDRLEFEYNQIGYGYENRLLGLYGSINDFCANSFWAPNNHLEITYEDVNPRIKNAGKPHSVKSIKIEITHTRGWKSAPVVGQWLKRHVDVLSFDTLTEHGDSEIPNHIIDKVKKMEIIRYFDEFVHTVVFEQSDDGDAYDIALSCQEKMGWDDKMFALFFFYLDAQWHNFLYFIPAEELIYVGDALCLSADKDSKANYEMPVQDFLMTMMMVASSGQADWNAMWEMYGENVPGGA